MLILCERRLNLASSHEACENGIFSTAEEHDGCYAAADRWADFALNSGVAEDMSTHFGDALTDAGVDFDQVGTGNFSAWFGEYELPISLVSYEPDSDRIDPTNPLYLRLREPMSLPSSLRWEPGTEESEVADLLSQNSEAIEETLRTRNAGHAEE